MSVHITGSGSFIPEIVKKNQDFINIEFLNPDGSKFDVPNEVIIKKFQSITGIEERRYVSKNDLTSDIAHSSAKTRL